MAIGEVGDIADSCELFARHRVFDFVNHAFGPHEVGQLGDDETRFPRPYVFDADLRPCFEASAASGVGVRYSLDARDSSATGQVWPRNEGPQVPEGRFGVLEQMTGGSDNFDQIVRGHVCRHSHRNAACSVNEQMGNSGGEHAGLG